MNTEADSAGAGSMAPDRSGDTGDMRLPARWLVRHPRPDVPEGVCYGRTDLSVTPEALERTACQLSGSLPRGAALRTSPLLRCRLLADRLHALRPDLHAPRVDDWLAEMDFGLWEGRPWNVLPPAALQAWTDDFGHYRAGGQGESVAQFLARIRQGLAASAQRPGPEVWIAHAGVIRAVYWLLHEGRNGSLPTAAQWPGFSIGFGEIWRMGDETARMSGR